MGSMKVNNQIDKIFKDHIKQVERAKVIAVNRAGRSALAQTVMFIRKAYNIKSSDLKGEIKVSIASRGNSKFKIKVSHKAIGLIKYGAVKQTKAGVSATISKGKRQKFKSGFITTVGKGMHMGVFKRVGKPRLPIKELYGPSAMQLMSSDEVEKFINKIFQDKFETELIAALKYGK